MADHMTDTKHLVEAPRISVPVEYNKRDLLLYAVGIGCTDRRYVYEGSAEFAAFPTYPICLTFKGASPDVLPYPTSTMLQFGGDLLPGTKVGLDAEKYIEKVRELPRDGARLWLRGGVVGVQKKRAGALVEQAFDLVDDNGEVYYKIISGGMQVGATNFTPYGTSHSLKVPPPSSDPWRVVEVPLGEHVANVYRLSGDYNPLHVDPAVAADGGFTTPILHGLCTLGHAVRALLDVTAGGDQRRYKSVRLRFASPVIPGQTLLVEVWQASSLSQFIFQTKIKETGKVCLSDGVLVLNPSASL
eukprot:TRINITY_DN68431_c0_g1_i1.p1 TRINITY_DN68431_c0_g1~~TRINITY_DN68431_c0_g1_i1.p1  ORF type:complete len:312 (+),score=31.47 TRINITY_DN68431_c0_g1_i1:36-938(+)